VLRRGCLILCYHHIAKTSMKNKLKRFYVSPQDFARQMEYLYKNKYSVFQLGELAEILKAKKNIPSKSVILTFDDGYRSFLNSAKDILKSYGFKATIFIPTGKIGSVNDWDEGAKDDINIMSWDEIRFLSVHGFSFHSHTVNHVELPSLSDPDIMDELERSKQTLESALNQREHFFCYPCSKFNEHLKYLVKEAGYTCACTSMPGKNDKTTDLFLLKRIEVEKDDTIARFIYKIHYNRFFGKT